MAFDTPARIAILGAGPIGLEAALYARFLGYEVDIYDRGEVASNVQQWGHVRMFTPYHMNTSPLGLAALAAQDEEFECRGGDELITGAEWRDEYLLPLSRTDLLIDHLRLRQRVVSVGRLGALKSDTPGSAQRQDDGFCLLSEDAAGDERRDEADIVIDCSGVFGNSNHLGTAGIPAVGERRQASRIEYSLPDILGERHDEYAGQGTLVIGRGFSAATNVVALAELSRQHPATKVTWAVRSPKERGPMQSVENDPLASRAELVAAANQLTDDETVTLLSATTVDAIEHDGTQFVVLFRQTVDPAVREVADPDAAADIRSWRSSFDRIIANVGYRPDTSLFDELQVHLCYASQGPMKLAAQLLSDSSQDCLQQSSHGAESLCTPEPDFYILGAKSYGRNPDFLFSLGLQQIRELFAMIGDRADLDLYSGARTLP